MRSVKTEWEGNFGIDRVIPSNFPYSLNLHGRASQHAFFIRNMNNLWEKLRNVCSDLNIWVEELFFIFWHRWHYSRMQEQFSNPTFIFLTFSIFPQIIEKPIETKIINFQSITNKTGNSKVKHTQDEYKIVANHYRR